MAKAGKGTMAITVEPVEFRNLIRLLGSLPKESQQEIRDRALPLSQRFAGQLLQFAQASRTPVAVKVAAFRVFSGVVKEKEEATGVALARTLIVTVATFESEFPSLALNVKLSGPE